MPKSRPKHKKRKRAGRVHTQVTINRRKRTPLLTRIAMFVRSLKRPAKLAWSAIGIVAVGFGIYVGYVQLSPRISVSASAALNPSDPFSTPFVISNDGYLPIRDVEFLCRLTDVNARPPGINLSFENISVQGPDQFLGDKNQQTRDIAAGGHATTKCNLSPLFPVMPIENADISITVIFRPAFFRSQKAKYFRFVTARGSDGQLRWIQQS